MLSPRGVMLCTVSQIIGLNFWSPFCAGGGGRGGHNIVENRVCYVQLMQLFETL